MKCLICEHDEMKNSTTTVTLERGQTTLVIKDAPARVCPNCGEAYFEPDVTDALLEMLEAAVADNVQVEVRAYPIVQAS